MSDDASTPTPAAHAPLARTKAILFDLDGCLWFGDTPADGAPELLEDVRASGRRVGFVSNVSSTRAADVSAKLHRLGFTATPDEVIVPLDLLAAHPLLAGRPRALVIGNDAVRAAVAEATKVTHDPQEAELVVLARDRAFDYGTLSDALQPLLRGAPLLALNVDARVPAEGGRIEPGAGALAASLETAAGVRAEVVGKPAPSFFQAALRRFGVDAAEAAIVGDTLDADIAGGSAAGMITVHVGTNRGSAHRTPPVPDHAVSDVRGVRALLGDLVAREAT